MSIGFMFAFPGMAASQAANKFERAILLFDAKRYADARTSFEGALRIDKNNARIHYFLGRTYLELCEYKKAVHHSKKAVALQANNADYQFWLGRIYGEQAKHSGPFRQAMLASRIKKRFERTIELDPAHVGGRIGLGNFYLQAPSVMGGSIDNARTQAQALIASSEARGSLLLARIHEKEGKFELADMEYKNTEKAFDNFADAYESYGRFLLKRERYQEAIEKFKRQLALAPNEAQAHKSLGDAYKAVGRLQEAKDEYRTAAKIEQRCETAGEKTR